VVTVPLTSSPPRSDLAGRRPAGFVDIDERTYTMGPEKLRSYLEAKCVRSPRTKPRGEQAHGSPVTASSPDICMAMADMDPIPTWHPVRTHRHRGRLPGARRGLSLGETGRGASRSMGRAARSASIPERIWAPAAKREPSRRRTNNWRSAVECYAITASRGSTSRPRGLQ